MPGVDVQGPGLSQLPGLSVCLAPVPCLLENQHSPATRGRSRRSVGSEHVNHELFLPPLKRTVHFK